MTISVYQCDTCERTIEKQQNPTGLEVLGRCVITNNCKGFLYKTETKLYSVSRFFPKSVEGLEDWRQRRILYTHQQTTQSSSWLVQHNLNTHPSVQVFEKVIDDVLAGTTKLVPIEPDSIQYLSGRNLIINFNTTRIGTAQCISRNSTSVAADNAIIINDDTIDINNIDQISTNNIITIASSVSPSQQAIIEVEVEYLSSRGLQPLQNVDPLQFGLITANSLWHPFVRALINGKIYYLRSAQVNVSQLLAAGLQDGTSFYFKSFNGNTVQEDENFILLTSDPHETIYDRDYNNVLDFAIADQTTATTTFIFKDNEMYVNKDRKQPIFPPINTQ